MPGMTDIWIVDGLTPDEKLKSKLFQHLAIEICGTLNTLNKFKKT